MRDAILNLLVNTFFLSICGMSKLPIWIKKTNKQVETESYLENENWKGNFTSIVYRRKLTLVTLNGKP
jgi:hypothetical protein